MEIDAGLFYGEARVRSADPLGDVGPDQREDRRRLVAVPEGNMYLRLAEGFRDRAYRLKVLRFVEEVYTRPEAVLRLGHTPPELLFLVDLSP